MAVQLVLDYFGIDSIDALVVEPCEASVNEAHQRITQHLRNQSPTLCRVRLSNEALYQRFKYLEGMRGVLLTQPLIPRLLLAEKLNSAVPDWLTNDMCVALNLLSQQVFTEFECFEKTLLSICANELISGQDFYAFVGAVNQQSPAFLSLLAIDSLKKCLLNHLIFDLNIAKDTAVLFITELLLYGNCQEFLTKLAYQQHLFQLRGIINRYELSIALPAQILPTPLFSLPLLPLTETAGQPLVEKFLFVLNSITRKILANEVPVNSLADLFIVDWPVLWAELNNLIDLSPCLISDTLAQQVAIFTSPEAVALAKKLTRVSYPLLEQSASVETVLAWSEGYFDYCRHAFSYKQTLDESINGSFTDWLLEQSPRIARSNADWRQCSQRIHDFLKADYLVVVVMVDALSALNQSVVLAELQSLIEQEHLTQLSEVLFAPLPTLTEVGKMAVLTGKVVSQLPNDQEAALRQSYQHFLPTPQALKIVRSWKESSEHLDADTNLLVFFENRLDGRLHECVSFEKHCADLKPISSQITSSIQRWTRDAMSLGRDIAIFITADHGMTVTQEQYTGEQFGDIKERVFKLNSAVDLPEDFVKIDHYAVPKKRVRLTANALLTHGGLTPEEVLIPLITLTSRPPTPCKTPLEVDLSVQNCIKLGHKQWQLELNLMASETVNSIKLTLAAPFCGKGSIDSLRAGSHQSIILKFSSEQDQEGLTEMTLLLSYNSTGTGIKSHEENQKLLSVQFPASLLEKDSDTQNFEDMF
ncbi:MAG: hypothetical protein Q7U38_16540 [Methylobacter sp.]|nr:hypothetical protein [Methylobacter sp.]MDP2097121.1 hypothetical protein [Methylobacter sp.]MDP2428204.1 hypothetical protein [Methylobacter sp.]MDP3055212.1 hypothetical protein [Methylobacter sp.]MDP3362523.1 hypothetical protein [Methylobacter sp.]